MSSPTASESTRRVSRFPVVWPKFNPSLTIGLIVAVLLIAAGVTSLFWTPWNVGPSGISPRSRMLPPGSGGYLLGTDQLGRDILSQLMVGIRTSLIVSLLGVTSALAVGLAAAFTAVTFKGTVDDLIMRVVDVLMAFPGIVFALVLAVILGPGIFSTIVALTVFFAPNFIRVIRAAALRVLSEDFIVAARIYGRRQPTILVRHVLPNVLSVIIVQFSLSFAAAIIVESSLSYLGVGLSRPAISLGMMLREAQAQAGTSGWLTFWPGLAIAITVLGFNIFGDGLRDALDPKFSRGGR
jgi:peptide/nickel transport system permease protein